MLRFIVQRLLILPILLILFSMIVFWLVDAPPGDYLTSYISLAGRFLYSWRQVDVLIIIQLDEPVYIRYVLGSKIASGGFRLFARVSATQRRFNW